LWELFSVSIFCLEQGQGEMSSGKFPALADAFPSKLAMSFFADGIWMRRGFSWERLCPRLGNGWEKIEVISA